MTSLKACIKTISNLSDTNCLEIHGGSLPIAYLSSDGCVLSHSPRVDLSLLFLRHVFWSAVCLLITVVQMGQQREAYVSSS